MSKIRGSDTRAEVIFRKALWHLGYRFRKNYKGLPGKPDIVFTKAKVAIFIDGEFWHGFNWEEKKSKIKNNKDYWINKIERNMRRDKEVTAQLTSNNWFVIRFWSKEVTHDLNKCIEITISAIEKEA